MNVLSLFDGMSCCHLALDKIGVKVNKYYASEIKPHAIKVTNHNYPKTIQLGDVTKWKGWDIEKPDLITFGSPCQDFSRANKERDGLEGMKSRLFYDAIDILNYYRPKNFLMENVIMDEKQCQIINDIIGVYPIRINSSLVSAQLRDRLYWTNIPGDDIPDFFGRSIAQPENKNIKLQDVLTSGYTDREKSTCILEGWSRPNNINSWERVKKRHKKGFYTIIFENEDLLFNEKIRFMNQLEMEKCQTVPEGYTSILNRNQSACLLGDGWTVDIIAHIFKGLLNG